MKNLENPGKTRRAGRYVLIHILGLQPRDSAVMLCDKILKIIQLYVFPRYGNTYHKGYVFPRWANPYH